MIENNVEEGDKNAEDTEGMSEKRGSGKDLPTALVVLQPRLGAKKIGKGAYYGCCKGDKGKKFADLTGQQMFVKKLGIQ